MRVVYVIKAELRNSYFYLFGEQVKKIIIFKVEYVS